MSINIRVLGSTSSGNCTVIWNHSNSILVDCGFSPRYTAGNLAHHNLNLNSLSGVLITHAHSDHVNHSMLKKLVSAKVPIYCHSDVSAVLTKHYDIMLKAHELNLLRIFQKKVFSVGDFTVRAFQVPHDSRGGCFGFNLYYPSPTGKKKITIATDMGYPQDSLYRKFLNSDVILIESNHDTDMLDQSMRPAWLKRRIKKIGHLSNEQCAAFLEKVLSCSDKKPKAIILAHISQECNTNTHAVQSVENMLALNKYSEIEIVQTYKRMMNKCICV